MAARKPPHAHRKTLALPDAAASTWRRIARPVTTSLACRFPIQRVRETNTSGGDVGRRKDECARIDALITSTVCEDDGRPLGGLSVAYRGKQHGRQALAISAASDFRWKVVAAVFVIAALTWGVGLYGITTLLAALKGSGKWSTSVLSAAMSLHYLTSAVLVPLLVRAHRLIGIAMVTQAGAVFMAAGVIAWAHADSASHLALAALLTGVGWAATGTTAITAMISAWFDQDRPRALGLALNGISMGGLIFAPIWPAAIGGLGISAATYVVGIGACLTICVLASVFLAPTGPYCSAQPHPDAAPAQPRRILPTWKFQSVAISFGLSLLAAMGVLVHLTAYLAALWGLAVAGLAVSLVTVSTIAGRVVVWRWMQGLSVRVTAAACFLVSAAGSALLTVANMPELVVLGCVLFGLGGASLNFIPALIAQREYEASITPTVVGLFGSAAQLAIVVAPFAMGALSDAFGAYRGPFLLAALLLSSASALVLSHRDRDRARRAPP